MWELRVGEGAWDGGDCPAFTQITEKGKAVLGRGGQRCLQEGYGPWHTHTPVAIWGVGVHNAEGFSRCTIRHYGHMYIKST